MRRLGLVLAGLVLLAGCGYGGVPAAEAPPVNGDPVVSAPVAPAVGVPVLIAIPKLGVVDDVVPVTVKPDGAMNVPPVEKTGWWSENTRPGDPGPPALVLSHVSYKGVKGAFNRLTELRVGDAITVTDDAGTVHSFVVTERRTFKKSAFDENHDLLFDDRGTDDLVAVTCGGTLIGHSFDSNVAVRATAVSV
jgi:sortase (surface protein transpeptidase)